MKTAGHMPHCAVAVREGNDSELHRHRIASLVTQEKPLLMFSPIHLRSMERTALPAHGAASLIALHQNVFPAGVPNHLVTLVSSNAFCALVPKQDRPISIGDVDSHRERIQNRQKDLGIPNFRHDSASTTTVFIVCRESKLQRVATRRDVKRTHDLAEEDA